MAVKAPNLNEVYHLLILIIDYRFIYIRNNDL